MRTRKEKPLSKRKQKRPEVREVSPVDGCSCLWCKRFLEQQSTVLQISSFFFFFITVSIFAVITADPCVVFSSTVPMNYIG